MGWRYLPQSYGTLTSAPVLGPWILCWLLGFLI